MIWLWLGFFATIAALLALDLFVFHREDETISLRSALAWSGFWIALGVSFSGVVYLIYENHWLGAAIERAHGESLDDGTLAAIRYLTAYVLEKSLSLDNIFVMVAVFGWFKISPRYQHRVLFWGIIGAIAARASMLTAGIWLVQHVTWSFYVFGGILLVTGVRMLFAGDEHDSPDDSRLVRILKRYLPISTGSHGAHFIAVENGRRVATSLALALIVIEVSDVIFAVDSVPAVLAVSTDTFIVVTSNVFAILGLRSLYFVLADMIQRFRHLGTALSLLLLVIGTKMILHSVIVVPNLVALAVIVVVVSAGIVASLLLSRDNSG